MSDRNEWFKDVKRLIRGLEVETVEDPFAKAYLLNEIAEDAQDMLNAIGDKRAVR